MEWKRDTGGWLSFPMKMYTVPKSEACLLSLRHSNSAHSSTGLTKVMTIILATLFWLERKGRPDIWRESKLTLENPLLFSSFNPFSLTLKPVFSHWAESQKILKMSCSYQFPQFISVHVCVLPIVIHSSIQSNDDNVAQMKDKTGERIRFPFHVYIKDKCSPESFSWTNIGIPETDSEK